MRNWLLSLPLLLAACASPLERCVANANQDIRVMDRLIAVTRGNIERGYAIRTEEYFETEKQVCGDNAGDPIYCDIPVAQEREVPVAIDLNAERAKLQSLLQARDQKVREASAAIAQCRQVYPEA